MSTSFTHTVAVGDSPATVSAKYHIDWASIKDHPANAFIKQRETHGKYPLHPGDRLLIPNRDLPTHWTDHAQSVQGLISYLWTLILQHPSYPSGVNLYSNIPQQKQHATMTVKQEATKTTKATASQKAISQTTTIGLQGYKKKHDRIWSNVVLTGSIESAFEVLVPYLPTSVVMTSGYRTDADQIRIINDYYKSKDGDATETDVEKRRQWLVKEKGLKIAKVGSSPHRTGLAFDLSGADVETINKAVTRCAAEQGDCFPLHSTIIEKNQNCLHVNLKY